MDGRTGGCRRGGEDLNPEATTGRLKMICMYVRYFVMILLYTDEGIALPSQKNL
jgi:hypothetical protein